MKNKKVIVILGPTAVGKTTIAVQLAQYFHTSIISADSRQCFKELNIGVAKPSSAELKLVPHFFINSHSVTDDVNAALFEQLASQWTEDIFRNEEVLILVGGTGLYIKAFCEGLDDMPAVSTAMREEIHASFRNKGMAWLQEQIRENDPVFYATGEILNPHRLMRALEIKLTTGKSITSYRSRAPKQRPFDIIKIGLHLPKEKLHANIDARVRAMMSKGLTEEVSNLLPYRDLNALRTVGYTELFDYLDGKIPLSAAVEMIKTNTKQYAKRQLTWFRKDHSIQWIYPDQQDELKKIIKS